MQTDDFHLDQTVFSRGFTLLESASKIPRERLATAGRGPTADPDNTKRLYYSKGLICITQFDFGSVIVPEGADTGQTWHEGLRSEGGMLALIDVITEPTALPRT